MPEEYRIIDADGHVMEIDDQLREYLPSPYADLEWHRCFSLWPGLDGYIRALRAPGGWAGGGTGPNAGHWVDFLDTNRIEATVLFPTQGLGHALIQDRDYAIAIARAYNDWLYHRFLNESPRLLGVALLPTQQVGEAVKELRRCVTELGMVGAVLPSVTIAGKGYGEPEYHPIWAEAERLDVPLATHGGSSAQMSLDLLHNFTVGHTLEHPFSQMRQLASMMFESVFERFPKLRFAYLECGAGWLPYLMDRMDEEIERKAKYSPNCKRKPSEYIRDGNIFVTAEVEEGSLPFVLEYVRPDVILWASDFPHERDQRDFKHDIPHLLARDDISAEHKRAIFFDNPNRFFRLQARGKIGAQPAIAGARGGAAATLPGMAEAPAAGRFGPLASRAQATDNATRGGQSPCRWTSRGRRRATSISPRD